MLSPVESPDCGASWGRKGFWGMISLAWGGQGQAALAPAGTWGRMELEQQKWVGVAVGTHCPPRA